MPRLKERYNTEFRQALMERFGYKNVWQAPRLEKVSLNIGISAKQDGGSEALDAAIKEMTQIAGQRAVVTKAKTSVAAFGVREGMPVGVRVTLRGDRMWEFVDRLISIALPRIRDFRGVKRDSFDGRGSYSFGIDDQLIFPELGYDDVAKQRGMSITLVTTARNDEEGTAFLELLGMPFVR